MYTRHFVSIGLAMLTPTFIHRLGRWLFKTHEQDTPGTKATMESWRYALMAGGSTVCLACAYAFPENQTLVYGLGFAGVIGQIDALVEYWHHMNEGVRIAALGACVVMLAYYALRV